MQTRFLLLLFALGLFVFVPSTNAQMPSITGFAPAAAHPRAVLTIFGSNLNAGTGARHVFVGNVKAQVLSVSADSIQVRVPFGATVGPIVLSANNKTVSSNLHFVPTYPASTATPSNLNFWPTEGNVNIVQSGMKNNFTYKNADLDNDGKVDLITNLYILMISGNSTYAPFYSKIRIFKNISGITGGLANTNFGSPLDFIADSSITPGKYNWIYDYEVGDINSDGNLDIVARTDSGVVFLINKGLGISATMFNRILVQSPELMTNPTSISTNSSLILKDFDGNGKLDVLVTTPNSLVVLVNNSISSSISQSSFQINRLATLPYSTIGWKIFSDDLSNDSKPDIVFFDSYALPSNFDTIFFSQNDFGISSIVLDSAAFLLPIVSKYLTYPITSNIEDFNQDGFFDLASNFSGNKLGFQNNSGGSGFGFSNSSYISIPSVFKEFTIVSDLTGDGKIDLAYNNSSSYSVQKNSNYPSSPVLASLFTGATYTRPTYGLDVFGPVCDLDNDGRPDLVTVKHASISSVVSARLLISRNTYNIQSPSLPTTAASVSYLNPNSIRINISAPGNGTGRVVLMKQGTASITGSLTNYTYYAATQNYNTAPTLSDGSKVVYIGDTNSITISNLSAYTSYQIKIVEVNGWANATNFYNSGGYTLSATTLPVTWLSFEGIKIEKDIALNWQTASEINSQSFVIERSFDNQLWQNIGKIKAAGNSNQIHSYSFTDKNPALVQPEAITVYYRLKQIDNDQEFSYSSIVAITLQNPSINIQEELSFNAFPVPFSDKLNIISNNKINFSADLYNTYGKLLESTESENGQAEFSTQSLPAGVYVALLKTVTGEVKVMKVVKE
ncbi:MAG: FG-GAP-like repeat-containing protein [Bacteroidia bacterium]|nr:FG-GAP-like repeat-containing protein [Bacteroidia bacterium]MCF8447717.1 FG-GAP-like repeat-containing protein [Bacteroidia bacterium]